MMSLVLIVLIALAGLLALTIVAAGVIVLLMQLGVIFKKAAEPTHSDQGGYSLNQGREVGRTDEG